MQRERSSFDSFPEPIDLNQGSIPNNSAVMESSSSWDNTLSPVENRLSNYMLGPADGNDGYVDVAANDTCHDFSSWARGESSSGANNIRGGEDSKTYLGWPSSLLTPCSGQGLDTENWSFEPPSNSGTTSSETLSMQNHRDTMNLNSNSGYTREQSPTFYASSSNVGAFTGSSSASGENNATWGSSCKRKALEGTSGQFYPHGGSSPSNQNIMHHHHTHIPGYASQGNLNISSSGLLNPSSTNYSEQINPTNSGVSMSRQPQCFFPSSSGLPESSARNLTSRSNHGRHETVLFDTPRGVSSFSRNTGAYSSPVTTYLNVGLNQPPHPMHVNEAGEIMHTYTWNGSSFDSRSSQAREEAVVTNVRTSSSRRINNIEYPNVTQDQVDWSFDPGNSNPLFSRNSYSVSGSRVGPESSSSTWLPHHQNPNHQRLSEGGNPWVPFHGGGTESAIQRSHFVPHFPSSSSSSSSLVEVGPSSRGQHRLDQRSAAGFLMDVPGEEINGWRSLTAVEGRHRLIRQMLTAMRRGVQFHAEEHMLVDPFMNGFADLHDRHRDMRLDVDSMSYEELLALEDRIGTVSTGLSDERIMSSMKQRIFKSICVLPNLEPCCICQENYINGDDIGILDCGHEFHTECIKQWLTQKNICPICKTTGLEI